MTAGLHKGINYLASASRIETLAATHDTNLLPFTPRLIFCGSDGNLVVEDRYGNVSTFAVTAGAMLPISPVKIRTTTTVTTNTIVLMG